MMAPLVPLVLSLSTAIAAPIIDVDDHLLQANQEGQQVLIYVTGTETVSGLNFYIEIANEDGTPASEGPVLTAIDVVGSGTVFQGYTLMDSQVYSRLAYAYVDTEGTPVTANGLLARVTISTLGYSSGTWALKLMGAQFGELALDTDFAGQAAAITNGTITVVPEPPMYVNLLFLPIAGAASWAFLRRGKARLRRARGNGARSRTPA